MLTKSQKRVAIGTAALIVFVLFVLPAINIGRYRLTVARSLSQVLGREVTVQGISIQTFPQPGLLLSGVAVADDPTISAEPILRADEVLATLRITSLWRGRLEISNLKLKYPSLNLVRANDGRWNLESLLERARQVPSAPTAKTRPETRARFPYIESDAGRINLKIGNEKKVFALNDADFAIWLAAEDEWRMRLEARPIRTDANLSDTGTLKVEGSWRRAAQLHETPISIGFWWDYGQLGQITQLAYGRDRGWRGGVHISGNVSGKPEQFAIKLDAKIEDFRRYDILSGESVSLELHCNSEYNFTTKQVQNLACQVPAGSGVILARGNYDFPNHGIDVSVTAENVPLQYLAIVARHAKRDMPGDMNATGMLSAAMVIKGEYGNRTWTGNGQVSDVEVRSNVLSQPLIIPASSWALVNPNAKPAPARNLAQKKKPSLVELPMPSSIAWRLQPVSLKIADNGPATLAAWISHDGYLAEIRGDADLARLFEVAKLAGLPTPASDLTGSAKGTVQISGAWPGFGPATVTGDAQLKNIGARMSGVATPLKISSAHFIATKDSIGLVKALGTFAGVHTSFDISAHWPQHCVVSQPDDPSKCGLQFEVAADQISLDEINSLLNPKAQKRPWYAALANSVMGSQRAKFPEIYAQGQLSTNKLVVKSVAAGHVGSTVKITPAGFSVTGITADLFGGKFSGELHSDFTEGTPSYRSNGKIQKLVMTNVAAAMKDGWASGAADVTYKGDAKGWNADELLASAAGEADFEWHDGALPHINVGDDGKPLHFRLFAGTLKLSDGILTVSESKLQSPDGIYLVSGTASLARRLELKLTRTGSPGFSITGPLERPSVSVIQVSATQAKLGPSGHP